MKIVTRISFVMLLMAYCMLTACSSDENNDSANGELVVEMDENQTLITSSLPHAFWQSVELYSLLEGASIYSDKQIKKVNQDNIGKTNNYDFGWCIVKHGNKSQDFVVIPKPYDGIARKMTIYFYCGNERQKVTVSR